MKKSDFLQDPQTVSLVDWMVSLIDGSEPLDFTHERGVDRDLRDALARYEWPPKSVKIETPEGEILLPGGSSFSANNAVLETLAVGLRAALHAPVVNEAELIGWAAAVMQWGGVLTYKPNGKGNGGWLDSMAGGSFSAYLLRALQALEGDDDARPHAMNDLRSNAGTTKIHSLLLPNFVIYDSRVAAALAWIVKRWAQSPEVELADHLCFACMRANTSKPAGKMRSPDAAVFPVFAPNADVRTHHRHATWNLRANWILQSAIEQLQDRSAWTSREVEAALFMMGDDLSWAARAGITA